MREIARFAQGASNGVVAMIQERVQVAHEGWTSDGYRPSNRRSLPSRTPASRARNSSNGERPRRICQSPWTMKISATTTDLRVIQM